MKLQTILPQSAGFNTRVDALALYSRYDYRCHTPSCQEFVHANQSLYDILDVKARSYLSTLYQDCYLPAKAVQIPQGRALQGLFRVLYLVSGLLEGA